MATCKGTSVSAGRQDDGQHAETLSVFERRCLFKRVSELHELVRLADLGAHAARDRAEGEDLASICIARGHSDFGESDAPEAALAGS